MHKEDRTNPYLTNQVRRSGSARPNNARSRLEQEEKREAIKASAQASQQSNTPSSETKLDQVGASIAKYSGKNSSSPVNRPVTRCQTKNSSPGSSNQNLNHFSQEINATYLSSPTDILQCTLYISRPCDGKRNSPTSQKLVRSSTKCNQTLISTKYWISFNIF